MTVLLILASLMSPANAQRKGPDLDQGAPQTTDSAEPRFDDTGINPLPRCEAQRLSEPVQLPWMPELFVRYNPSSTWGTQVMSDTIVSAAQELAWLLPDADPFLVGDISQENGGTFPGHKSHRSGIDADIGIYAAKGKQNPNGFRNLTASELDLEANWLLIRSFLSTGEVERILLDQSLINALRRYTISSGELSVAEADAIFPLPGAPRRWEMSGVVQHTVGHKNHMHLRLRCEGD